ncbi:eukaryotic translation initiation factor 3C [Striga asiatica]|uniref:Eukaryotic translation initiation factor 3C n=1 Tax=Striga asiatica TaxID=4170 RepID=A0A5A7RDP6_STRAF|nr:eukaryotic translation initiation factor 3C [Striga asiatica]
MKPESHICRPDLNSHPKNRESRERHNHDQHTGHRQERRRQTPLLTDNRQPTPPTQPVGRSTTKQRRDNGKSNIPGRVGSGQDRPREGWSRGGQPRQKGGAPHTR